MPIWSLFICEWGRAPPVWALQYLKHFLYLKAFLKKIYLWIMYIQTAHLRRVCLFSVYSKIHFHRRHGCINLADHVMGNG